MKDRHRRPLEYALVCIGVLVVALIVLGFASGHAIAASPDESPAVGGQSGDGHGEPPENATYVVKITPKAPDAAQVRVEISYEARSTAELQRARNETLDIAWFRGEEIVQDAMAANDLDSDAVEHPRRGYSVPRGDDAETITIRYSVQWTDIPTTDDDRIRIGPGFAAALESGDEFRVAVPAERWENWTVNRDKADTVTHAQQIYVWTIGDDPAPEIVLYRGDVAAESDDSLERSPAVAIFALLLIAGLLARRRRL
ncbi:hypothetical protein ACFQS4_02655 [Saliphagus sp. GCM10025317]